MKTFTKKSGRNVKALFFLTKYYQMISTIKEKNNAKNAV